MSTGASRAADRPAHARRSARSRHCEPGWLAARCSPAWRVGWSSRSPGSTRAPAHRGRRCQGARMGAVRRPDEPGERSVQRREHHIGNADSFRDERSGRSRRQRQLDATRAPLKARPARSSRWRPTRAPTWAEPSWPRPTACAGVSGRPDGAARRLPRVDQPLAATRSRAATPMTPPGSRRWRPRRAGSRPPGRGARSDDHRSGSAAPGSPGCRPRSTRWVSRPPCCATWTRAIARSPRSRPVWAFWPPCR